MWKRSLPKVYRVMDISHKYGAIKEENFKSSERVAGKAWKSSNREGSKTTCDWR